jgi:antitoxin component of MazEF toxin-antitoxin module
LSIYIPAAIATSLGVERGSGIILLFNEKTELVAEFKKQDEITDKMLRVQRNTANGQLSINMPASLARALAIEKGSGVTWRFNDVMELVLDFTKPEGDEYEI